MEKQKLSGILRVLYILPVFFCMAIAIVAVIQYTGIPKPIEAVESQVLNESAVPDEPVMPDNPTVRGQELLEQYQQEQGTS